MERTQGCLGTVLNVHWQKHITNKDLYGKLPRLSEKIRQKRVRFAGHFIQECGRSSIQSRALDSETWKDLGEDLESPT